jgi:glutamine synthetase
MENILSRDILDEETLFGFEQEYTMFNKAGKVYGWPEGGFPHPQGPFYCGVGLEAVYGRPLVEAHLDACIKVFIPTFMLAVCCCVELFL